MHSTIILLMCTVSASPASASLEVVASSFERGDVDRFYKAVAVVAGVVGRDPMAVANFDAGQAAEGKPSLGAMLFQTRATLAGRGASFLKPRPTPFEAVLLLPELNQAVTEVAQRVERLPAMATELAVPKTLEEFAPLFEELKSAQNQCGLCRDMASLGDQLQKLARRQRGLTEEQREALAADLKTVSDQLRTLHELAKSREVDLRLERASLAARLLADPAQADNIKMRLLASHNLDRDGAMLQALVKSNNWPSLAEQLKFPSASAAPEEMLKYLEGLVAAGREAAGSDWVVAQLLFTGIDYWMQGKYGRSQLVNGLVEPPDTRYQSVYVPSPLDEEQRSYTPERRHYYTWVWEERRMIIHVTFRASPNTKAPAKKAAPAAAPTAPIAAIPVKKVRQGYYQGLLPRNPSRGGGGGGGGMAGGNWNVMQIPYGHQYGPIDRPYSWTVKDVYKAHNWKAPEFTRPVKTSKPRSYRYATATSNRYVPPQDPNSVYRIVGHDEYTNALACFDALAKIASPGQRKAVDELISEREELAVETNHSKAQAHVLAEPNFPQIQRGLIWMAALARVEVAAARVGFAEQLDALITMAVPYDLEAYRHMIRDGLRSHYHALKTDTMVSQVVTMGNSTQVLAYLRRAQLTLAFLDATVALHKGTLSTEQLALLSQWRTELLQLNESLITRLKSAPA